MQLFIFALITAVIALLTYFKCRGARKSHQAEREYFLAGKGLSWIFVAGSLTLTNLNTDQLVGMNGNQMAVLAWWELSSIIGLFVLAKFFLPVYYQHKCTTTTELLEIYYQSKHIRAAVAILFLLGNVLIFLPSVLYTGSLFMKSLFGTELPLMFIAVFFAVVGAAYSIFGGLRAVAVSDTYSGFLLLTMGLLVVVLALAAINFDFSGIPTERLSLIQGDESPLPWHVLISGMVFAHIYYWCTNQTITQRAMAARNLKEARRGVLAASLIRLIIIPPMVVIPGIVSFKLFGDLGDAAYGKVVSAVLPEYLSGVFAAAIAAAVLTSFNSVLNSSAALYVCDLHQKYLNPTVNINKISTLVSILMVCLGLFMVPVYSNAESIINLVQELFGLLSMPILSIFLAGMLFKNVRVEAAIITVIAGCLLYAFFIFYWSPFHYLHMMSITLILCVSLVYCVSAYLNTRELVIQE